MKRLILFLALIATLCSCTKKEKTEQISRVWRVEKVLIGGADSTVFFNTLFKDYSLEIRSNNTFRENFKIMDLQNTIQGTWAFENKFRNLILKNDGQLRNFDVRELHNNFCKLYLSASDQEFHMVSP